MWIILSSAEVRQPDSAEESLGARLGVNAKGSSRTEVAEEERWELLRVRKSGVSRAANEQVDELRLLDASVCDMMLCASPPARQEGRVGVLLCRPSVDKDERKGYRWHRVISDGG